MAVFKGFPGLQFQRVKFKYFKHLKHLVRTLQMFNPPVMPYFVGFSGTPNIKTVISFYEFLKVIQFIFVYPSHISELH